jgi:phenylpyruvate tautomerase PptA (4-oxalocrotonate tautomerase family)
MPIAQLYLVPSAYDPEAITALLAEASSFYAAALYPEMETPPVERVRIFITAMAPDACATGGVQISNGGVPAPYFSCIAMKGRPPERIQAMMAGWTDLIVRHLQCDASLVRGRLIEIEPEHWYISGVPASELRAAEIAARTADPKQRRL